MAPTPDERITFRQVLSHKDYFRVWLSQAVSYIGDRLTQVALMIFVVQLSEASAAAVALFLVAQSLPVVLFGPFVGVLVDRWDKRKTMVACDLIRAAIICVVPLLGDARLVYLIGFLMSAVSTVFTPALQASVPELLEKREEIIVANSLMYSTKFFTDILGFSLAGAIVLATGVRIAFIIDGVTFLASTLLLVRIGKVLVAGNQRLLDLTGYWEDMKAGIRYHKQNPVVMALLVSFAIGVLAMGGLNTLLMVAVRRLLQVSDFWWGFLLATQAVTMFAAAAAIGRWAQKVPRPFLILPGFLATGLCAVGLSMSYTLPMAFVLYAVLGAANSVFLVPSISWIQEIVPFELRGRVLGLRGMVLNLANIVSCLIAGPLGDSVGVSPVLAGVGVLLALTAFLSALLPGYREAFRRPAGAATAGA